MPSKMKMPLDETIIHSVAPPLSKKPLFYQIGELSL